MNTVLFNASECTAGNHHTDEYNRQHRNVQRRIPAAQHPVNTYTEYPKCLRAKIHLGWVFAGQIPVD